MKVINREKKTSVEQKNTGSRIRGFVKRSLVTALAVTVLVTSVPITSFAEATGAASAESNIGTVAPVENEAAGAAPTESSIGTVAPVENEATGAASAGAPSEQPEQPAKLTNTSEEPEQTVETASPSEEPEQAVKTATPSEFPKQLRTLVEELPTEATISEITDREEIIYSLDIIALIRKVVALLTDSLLPDSTDYTEDADDDTDINHLEDGEIIDDRGIPSETDVEDESTSEIKAKRATVPEATYYISENNLRPLSEEAKEDYEENIAPVLDERENLLNERLEKLAYSEELAALIALIEKLPTEEKIKELSDTGDIIRLKEDIYTIIVGREELTEEEQTYLDSHYKDDAEISLEEYLTGLLEAVREKFFEVSILPEELTERIWNVASDAQIEALTDRSEIWQIKGDISYIKASEDSMTTLKKRAAALGVDQSELTEDDLLTTEEIAYYKENILPVLNKKAEILDDNLYSEAYALLSEIITEKFTEEEYESFSDELKDIIGRINTLPLTEDEVNTIYLDGTGAGNSDITPLITLVTRTIPNAALNLSAEEQELYNNSFDEIIGAQKSVHKSLLNRRTELKGEPLKANHYISFHPDGKNFQNYSTSVKCVAYNNSNYWTISASDSWKYEDAYHAIGNNDCDLKISSVTETSARFDVMKNGAETAEWYTITVTPKASTTYYYRINRVAYEKSGQTQYFVNRGNTGTWAFKGSGYEGYVHFDMERLTKRTKPTDNQSFTWDGTVKKPTIPSNTSFVTEPTATAAGTYTATVKLASGYIWSDGTEGNVTITYTIDKADSSVTTVPVLNTNTMTYNGSSQSLLTTAGASSTGSTMQYAVTTSNSSTAPTSGWGTSYSVTNAGTYYVWYYAKGDDNHNDTTKTKLGSKIIGKKSITPVLSSTSYTYSGSANTPTISSWTNIVSGESLTSGTDYSITYSNNTNAGTGTATVALKDTTRANNYSLSTSALNFTIKKKAITPSLSATSFVYTGAGITPTVSFTGIVSGQSLTKDTHYTLTYSDNINVGTSTAKVLVTLKDQATANNYTLGTSDSPSTTKTLTYSITNATITTSGTGNKSYTYNTKPQGTGITATSVDGKTVAVRYRLGTSGEYTLTSVPQVTNVADSPITVGWQASLANHTTKTGSFTITITKADPTVTKPTVYTNLTYNHNAQVIASTGTTTGGTLQYALGADGSTAPTSGWKTTIDKKTDAGDYYVWYKVVGDSNWKDVAATYAGKAVIGKATINASATLGVATWNGSATDGGAKVEVTAPASGYTVKYGTSSTTCTSSTIPKYTNAGTYTVYYKVTAPSYNDKTGSFTITINKATLGAKPSATATKTYTGSELDNGVSYNTNSYVTKTGDWKGTNAGTYTATYTPDANHMWSDGTRDTVTVKFTISRASIGSKPATTASKTYTGSELDSGISYNTNSYVIKTGDWKGTNAGTYTATYTPDDNHMWSDGTITTVTVKFTINRASVGDKPTNPAAVTYTGEVQDNGISYNTNGFVNKTGDCKGTNAGTYIAIYTPDSNHCWTGGTFESVEITFTINRKAIGPKPTDPAAVTYDRTEKSNNVTYNTGYSDSLSISGDTKGTNAGTYTATYTPDGNHCWNSIDDYAPVSITLTINPYDISLSQIGALASHKYAGKYAYEDDEVKAAYLNPVVTALETTLEQGEDKDFTIAYDSPSLKTVSPYDAAVTLTVTGHGNYTGTKTATYTEVRKDYTITYNGNSTDSSLKNVPEPGTKYYDIEYTLSNIEPTLTGAAFEGWSYTATSGIAGKLSKIESAKNEDTTLYAIWSYSVTLNANGGTIRDGKNITEYSYGPECVLPTSVNEPEIPGRSSQVIDDNDEVYRVGYDFAGWFDNEACTGTNVTKIAAGSTGAREYWAKWTPRSDIKYIVQHVKQPLNGTVVGDYPDVTGRTESDASIGLEVQTFYDGTADADKTAGVKEYEGFKKPEANPVKINPDGTTVVLYRYERRSSYQVLVEVKSECAGYGALDADGFAKKGSITRANIPYEANIIVNDNKVTVNGFVITASHIDNSDEFEYSFVKWQDQNGTQLTGTTVVKSDMQIYAVFERKTREYKVEYYNADGTAVHHTIQKVPYNTDVATAFADAKAASPATVTDPVKTTDHKATYTFSGGWSSKAGGAIETIKVTGDMKVYPVFDETINTYPVIFDANPDNAPDYNNARFEYKEDSKPDYMTILETDSQGRATKIEVQAPYGGLMPADMTVPTKNKDLLFNYEYAGWKLTESEPEDPEASWPDAPVVGTYLPGMKPGDPGTFAGDGNDTWVTPIYYAYYAPLPKIDTFSVIIKKDTDTGDYGDVSETTIGSVTTGARLTFTNTTEESEYFSRTYAKSSKLDIRKANNDVVMLTEATAKTEDGTGLYEFDHWEVQRTHNAGPADPTQIPDGPAERLNPNSQFTISSNVTITAVFKKTSKSYSITYHRIDKKSGLTDADISDISFIDAGGHIQLEDSIPHQYASGTEIVLPKLVKGIGDYRFLGWTDSNVELSDDDASVCVDRIKATDTGNKDFYAHWQKYLSVNLHTKSFYGKELSGVGYVAIAYPEDDTEHSGAVNPTRIEKNVMYKVGHYDDDEESEEEPEGYVFRTWELSGTQGKDYMAYKKVGTEYVELTDDWKTTEDEFYIRFRSDTDVAASYEYAGTDAGIRLTVRGEEIFKVAKNGVEFAGEDGVKEEFDESGNSFYTFTGVFDAFDIASLIYEGENNIVWMQSGTGYSGAGVTMSKKKQYDICMIVEQSVELKTNNPEEDKYFIEFWSQSDDLISSGSIAKNAELSELLDMVPEAPASLGKIFVDWKLSDGTLLGSLTAVSDLESKLNPEVTGNSIIFTPKYDFDPELSKAKITVINVLKGDTKIDPSYDAREFKIGENISITARSYRNLHFNYWADALDAGNNPVNIIGTSTTYPMHITGDRTIYAIYSEAEKEKYPVIDISDIDTNIKSGKEQIHFQVTWDVPELSAEPDKFKLHEAGVLYATRNFRDASYGIVTDEAIDEYMRFAEDDHGNYALPYDDAKGKYVVSKVGVFDGAGKHSGYDAYINVAGRTTSCVYMRGYMIVDNEIYYTDIYEACYDGIVDCLSDGSKPEYQQWFYLIKKRDDDDPSGGESGEVDPEWD